MSNDYQSHLEIQKQYRENQSKFIYYLIALSVASIGFSINITIGQKLNYSHFLLGLAILNWVLSVFCGFQFLKISINVLALNNEYFNIVRGLIDEIKPNDFAKEKAKNILIEESEKKNKRLVNNFNWQQYFFFIGIILFLFWHIVQMINR
jgi:hypothetical protein